MFLDALSYPVRGSGWLMILLGAILGVILDIGSIAPVIGLAVFVFAGGYFCAFYFDIISSTMCDHDDIPDWPGFSDFLDEIVMPLITLIGLLLLSFWPVIALTVYVFNMDVSPSSPEVPTWYDPAMYGLLFLGCCYFPMAIIANQAFGTFTSALPHVVLPAIFKALPSYFIPVVALILVWSIVDLGQSYAERLPFVGWFLAWAVALYGLMFQARLIGLIYRDKQDVLDFP